MASASNPEALQSTTEKVHIDDIVSKDLMDANRSRQELPERDDKQKSPTILKPPRSTESVPELFTFDDIVSRNLMDANSSRQEQPERDDKQKSPTILKPPRNTETVPELFTNEKSKFIGHTQSDLLVTAFSYQELPEADNKQGSPIGRKPSSPIRTEILKDKSTESSSNPEIPHPTTKVHIDISKCLMDVNHSLQDLLETDDKQKSPTTIKPPKSTEPVKEHCAIWKSNFVEPTLRSPVKTAFYENALEIEANISKHSRKKVAPSVENIMISSETYSKGKGFPEDTGSVETVSIPLDSSGSREVEKFPNVAANSKLDQMALNTTRTSDVSPSTLYNPLFQICNMPPVSFPKMEEFSKSSYQEMKPLIIADMNCDKSLAELLFKMEQFSKSSYQEMKPPIIADMNCDKSLTQLFSKMEEFSKSLYQEMKPSTIADMSSDKSLTELLSILEDWAKKGMDNAFNNCTNFSFLDIKARFKNDVQYGLNVMKQMSTRVHTLMRAASKLPDPDTILAKEFQFRKNRVRGDLITYGFVMWLSIHDIELQISHDLKILEIMCDNVSKLSTEYAKAIEELVNPYNIVTNLYTSVISSFLMLRTEMENFHEKITVFCFDLEGLL